MTDAVFAIPLSAQPSPGSTSQDVADQTDSLLSAFVGDASCGVVQVAVESFLHETTQFNPLVFCGSNSTGKTLLARVLFSRYRQAQPRSHIVLVTGSDFARSYAEAVEANAVEDLRSRFRKSDLLVIDDLHLLVDKPAAQIELLHTIDHLLRSGRRVVATISNLPHEHRPLLPGLTSRLATGLQVRLTVPGPAARHEIVRRLAQRHDLQIADAALRLMAQETTGTVLQLNRIITHLAAANGSQAVDTETAARCLQQQLPSTDVSLQAITKHVARYFNQTVTNIRGPSRKQSTVRARGVAMFLSRELTSKSLEQIGHHFGRRDHTTVLHAYRKTQLLIESDEATRRAIDEIRQRVCVQL